MRSWCYFDGGPTSDFPYHQTMAHNACIATWSYSKSGCVRRVLDPCMGNYKNDPICCDTFFLKKVTKNNSRNVFALRGCRVLDHFPSRSSALSSHGTGFENPGISARVVVVLDPSTEVCRQQPRVLLPFGIFGFRSHNTIATSSGSRGVFADMDASLATLSSG
jgi:hypothetical protein